MSNLRYPYALRSARCEKDEVAHCLQSLQDILTYLIAPDQVAAIVGEHLKQRLKGLQRWNVEILESALDVVF